MKSMRAIPRTYSIDYFIQQMPAKQSHLKTYRDTRDSCGGSTHYYNKHIKVHSYPTINIGEFGAIIKD